MRVPADAWPHYGDAWFAWRARTLGISVEQARARDAALPDGSDGKVPAEGVIDEAAAREGALLWRDRCARCHGIDGIPPPPAPGQPEPRVWGTTSAQMGFLFGGDAMRAGMFRSISRGKGRMPAWGELLSREQIWALVRHIESF